MPSNLDKLTEASGAVPVVEIGDDDVVTVTVHTASAVYRAQAADPASAARKLLDLLDA